MFVLVLRIKSISPTGYSSSINKIRLESEFHVRHSFFEITGKDDNNKEVVIDIESGNPDLVQPVLFQITPTIKLSDFDKLHYAETYTRINGGSTSYIEGTMFFLTNEQYEGLVDECKNILKDLILAEIKQRNLELKEIYKNIQAM